ncbi:putative reverse transcriptase domain-containing protein, partial [Tanacetum coccineum]
MTKDYKAAFAATTQGDPVVQQRTITCFECGRQGHFKKDCPKLKKQICGKKAANREGLMLSVEEKGIKTPMSLQ